MAYSVVGKRVPRVDAVEKVTGQAKYGADIILPQILEGKILRSKYPHARVLNIDTRRAEALPGVKAVVTAKDMPDTRIGVFVYDQPICAREEVRYVGEPIAAIAAVDRDTVLEALDLIKVDYEELPAVFDPLAAMRPDAPIIHKDLASYKCTIPTERHGNILNHGKITRGDVGRGFAEADLVWEARYSTQVVDHGHIEPHESVASVDSSGRIIVWTGAHGAFSIRSMLSAGLEIPLSRIRVIGTCVGGSFGGKMWLFTEPFCVLLSQKTGRPVRIGMSREEEFLAGQHRHPAIIDLKTGAKKDGRLLVVQGKLILDTGAYETYGAFSFQRYAYLQGPYRFPNVDVEGYVVYTNNGVHGAMRGPMAPQVLFAVESQMDMMARELKLDPLDFRLKNAVCDGDLCPTARSPEGPKLRNVGLEATLRATKGYYYQEKRLGRYVGRGLACGQWATEPVAQEGPSSITIKVNEDGTVVLSTGTMELGGGAHTILAQIAAEELGIPVEDVLVMAQDTDATPYESGVGGSRATYRVGATAKMAAEEARNYLFRQAAARLEANIDDLDIGEGHIYVKGSRERGISIKELASASHSSRLGPIVVSSTSLRSQRLPDPNVARASVDNPCYSTHLCEAEVDPETGRVHLLDYMAAHDVGFAINPDNVEGQIEGGVALGVGYALTEECLMAEGKSISTSFQDYRMPTSVDIPKVDSVLIEQPSDFGPYGAKGVAEPPVIPVAAAVANAIYDAVGVRIRDLPITPEKVLRALKEKRETEKQR